MLNDHQQPSDSIQPWRVRRLLVNPGLNIA
jgi:hypothetical protein